MTAQEDFSGKIRQRLAQHEQGKVERKARIDGEMKQLLSDRERRAKEARRLLQSIVYPRMKLLSDHFGHSYLINNDETARLCKCEFPHTPEYPATVSFSIGFMPGGAGPSLRLYAETVILPIHIEYEKRAQLDLALDDLIDDMAAQWVETKILQFIDRYLQLETHPTYQKENLVRDPVCGMEISAIDAVGKVERGKQIYYFCSDACQQAFLKEGR